jgi:hypothetical protein
MDVTLGSYYDTNGMALAISIYRFPEDHASRPKIRTRALRYLFSHRRKYHSAPSIDELSRWGMEMFQEFGRVNNVECITEIADIMTEFAQGADRHAFLDRIRLLDEEKAGLIRQGRVQTRVQTKTKTTKTVYNDSQNVHDSQINKSVIKCLENLFEKYEYMIVLKEKYDEKRELYRPTTNKEKFEYKTIILDDIRGIFVSKYFEKTELINSTAQYIKTSTAIFGQKELGMIDAIIALWLWINEHEHKKELELRLLEEFKEMNGMCTTGHIARLMNVMQGFTDDENLCIRISSSDQCFAVVKQYLTKELQECKDEDVISEMIDGGENYVKFIRKCVAKKLLEWKKEYGKEMLTEIANVVNKFAHVTVFDTCPQTLSPKI